MANSCQYYKVRACAIARRTPNRKLLHRNIVLQALCTFNQIIRNLQEIIGRNIGMYFPCFLCQFSRGEEVVEAGGG